MVSIRMIGRSGCASYWNALRPLAKALGSPLEGPLQFLRPLESTAGISSPYIGIPKESLEIPEKSIEIPKESQRNP